MDRRGRVAEAVRAVTDAVSLLDRALPDAVSELAQEDWLELVGGTQGLVDRLTGVQDVAIAAASRFEGTFEDDGTVGSADRGPGRVALDAADLVAPRLRASHNQAQGRVEAAVRLTGRAPVPAESSDSPQRTGLDGLHAAMRAGRLDRYRAGIVADELREAPAAVADAVIAALDPHLDSEPAPALRRRTRRLLARISPDLLRQRAERARRETGLRRWVAEPGVDAWYGTFPSEASAAAWAAVDQVARRYVTEGVCSTIEEARGRALTDLVLDHSDVRVHLVLTTPAEMGGSATPTASSAAAGDAAGTVVEVGASRTSGAVDTARAGGGVVTRRPERAGSAAAGAADDLVQVHGVRPSEPVLVRRGWLEQLVADPTTEVTEARCHPVSGSRLDEHGVLAREGYRPGDRLVALVKARDGRCRFPGCSVAARFCDLDHVRPWPTGATAAPNLLTLCRRHHRVKQSPGWRVRLRADAVAEWTDPSGRTTLTHPVDGLDHLVLRAREGPLRAGAEATWVRSGVARPGVALPSVLEEALAHRLDQHDAERRHHRRCSPSAVREVAALFGHHCRRSPAPASGDPPF